MRRAIEASQAFLLLLDGVLVKGHTQEAFGILTLELHGLAFSFSKHGLGHRSNSVDLDVTLKLGGGLPMGTVGALCAAASFAPLTVCLARGSWRVHRVLHLVLLLTLVQELVQASTFSEALFAQGFSKELGCLS